MRRIALVIAALLGFATTVFAAAAVPYVDSYTSFKGSGTADACTLPAGTVNNDVLFFSGDAQGTNTVSVAPSGFTQIGACNTTFSGDTQCDYYKVITNVGGEPGT